MVYFLVKSILLFSLGSIALGTSAKGEKTVLFSSETSLFCDDDTGMGGYYDCVAWVESQKYFLGDRYVGFRCEPDPDYELCNDATKGVITYKLFKSIVRY